MGRSRNVIDLTSPGALNRLRPRNNSSSISRHRPNTNNVIQLISNRSPREINRLRQQRVLRNNFLFYRSGAGLDQDTINQLPTRLAGSHDNIVDLTESGLNAQRDVIDLTDEKWEWKLTIAKHKNNDNVLEETCSICLEHYKRNEKCIELKCNHVFHRACVSHWLQQNNSCPLCRCKAG
eukprot:NODE_63_length_26141_cov_1.022656.p18 type:complete len:179 gc:universal NODE_63_length_26141_cov_1.022656:14673-15209(+)